MLHVLGVVPLFTKSLSKVFTPEGNSCQLSVKVTGRPEPAVQWYRNGQPVRKDSRHSVTTDGESSTLTIRNVGVADEGIYSVRAENSAGFATCQGELLMESKEINIYYTDPYINLQVHKCPYKDGLPSYLSNFSSSSPESMSIQFHSQSFAGICRLSHSKAWNQ